MAHDDTARRVAYTVIGGSMAPKGTAVSSGRST